jgi:hypothetical protein
MLIALLLSVLAPRFPKVYRDTQLDRKKTVEMLDKIKRDKELVDLAYISFNLFFWFFIALLVAAVIIRYLNEG